ERDRRAVGRQLRDGVGYPAGEPPRRRVAPGSQLDPPQLSHSPVGLQVRTGGRIDREGSIGREGRTGQGEEQVAIGGSHGGKVSVPRPSSRFRSHRWSKGPYK